MSNQPITYVPRFMGPKGGRHFTLQVRPVSEPVGHIVYVPPLAEEMNRCRALVAEQARSFARAGYACTLVDFVGTGDSDGELRDVGLGDWYANLNATIETLQSEQSLPLTLWGMRLGGLLALDFSATSSVDVKNILLWQPVTVGKMYVTQVLRQRVASLMVKELPPETTKEIRQRLADGEQVEIAGYAFGGRLLDDIESIDLGSMSNLCSAKVHWLEHVLEEGKEPGVAAARAMEQLRTQGNTVDVHTFCDPQIWQIHERDEAPQLLAATRGLSL